MRAKRRKMHMTMRVVIGLELEYDWLKKWRQFSKPMVESRKTNKQLQVFITWFLSLVCKFL